MAVNPNATVEMRAAALIAAATVFAAIPGGKSFPQLLADKPHPNEMTAAEAIAKFANQLLAACR